MSHTRRSYLIDPIRPSRLAAVAVALAWLSPLAGCSWMSHGQNAQGVRMFEQGHYQGAIQQFQQAMATDPNNADGYYNLASTYHRVGKLNNKQEDLDQAESFYNQCLDHDSDHVDCYRGLAVLLADQDRSEEAFRLLEGWASRSPTSADARVELARLSEEFGRLEQAKEHLLEALTIDPYDARALAALGRLHETSGNQDQALANYERSLWNDRFQPEVASRISSLRAAKTPSAIITPPGGTRTVNVNPAQSRLN